MSRAALAERLRIVATTAAVTAVLTSVGWIVFGGAIMNSAGNLAVVRKVEPVGVATGADEASGDGLVTVREGPVRQAAGAVAKRTPAAQVAAILAGDYAVPVVGVQPSQLTDTFTQPRDGGARVHEAIDIMAPLGTPVVAASGGTVERLFTSRYGGLTVYVRSPDRRTISYYAHLDAYVAGLAEGQQVRRGQQIGTVGFTGNADPTAPHLHFAIMQTTPDSDWWEPATAINPYPILTGRR